MNMGEIHHILVVSYLRTVFAALDAYHNFRGVEDTGHPWSEFRYRQRQMEVERWDYLAWHSPGVRQADDGF